MFRNDTYSASAKVSWTDRLEADVISRHGTEAGQRRKVDEAGHRPGEADESRQPNWQGDCQYLGVSRATLYRYLGNSIVAIFVGLSAITTRTSMTLGA